MLKGLPKLVDGTNVPVGTDYVYREPQTTDWYRPRESIASPRWREKLSRVQDQFDSISRSCRPQPSMLVQRRMPAFGDFPVPVDGIGSPINSGACGSSLRRDFLQLFDRSGHPLVTPYPFKDIKGQPICHLNGQGVAYRLGLSRQHFLHKGPNYVSENRPLAGPQLADVAREASGLLFGLPAEISTVVWKNWKSGFQRTIDQYLWYDALFEMAWQHPIGSSLTADRFAWIENFSVTLSGDGLFPRFWLPPEFTTRIPEEFGYPLSYYSKIDDIARASVSMIDVLLDMPQQTLAASKNEDLDMNQPKDANSVTSTDDGTRDQVFISYSHKDHKKFIDALLDHLKPYTRNGSVTHWSDTQIVSGSKWFSEIQAALSKTKVAVLLVTPNFLASDFIHHHELGPLLKSAEAGGVKILWVRVRECSYEETPLKNLQAVVSPPKKPLADMRSERDAAWKEVCQEIKKALGE